MTGLLVLIGAAAVVGSLVLTPVVIRLGTRFDLVGKPDGNRHIHDRPIVRIGGIAVFAGTCVGLLAATIAALVAGEFAMLDVAHRPFLWALAVGAVIMFVTGVLDDAFDLRPRHKLAAQVLGAIIVYYAGFRINILSLGFGVDVEVGWLGLPLTVLWIVAVTNAYNLIDGLDGLATGIALIALIAVSFAAGMLGRTEVLLVSIALSGALLGFLPYNFNPARIFLGDSGSLFIGFMLAVLSVHGSMKSTTAVLTIVPLLALGVPLIDMGLSILRRWLRGSPVFGADARHIHHRLVAFGLTHRRAVVVLYGLSIAFAAWGLLLAFSPPTSLLVVALAGGAASTALVVVGLRGLDYDEFLVASAVLAAGPRRLRAVIQNKLQANDVARIISVAASRKEVEAILADHAADFGFLRMELVPESASGRQAVSVAFPDVRVWKLDFPVGDDKSQEQIVLRIWCAESDALRPRGAERVAHILALAVENAISRMNTVPFIEFALRPSANGDVSMAEQPRSGNAAPSPAVSVSYRQRARG